MKSFLRDLSIVIISLLIAAGLAGAGFYFFAPGVFSRVTETPGNDAGAKLAAPEPTLIFAGQLKNAGSKACLNMVETLGKASVDNATDKASMSNWYTKAPDDRIVTTFIGQKFGKTPALPFGLSGIIAAPNAGSCDGVSVRILPSPLSCADLQRSIIQNGKLLGTLSGVPVLQSANSQVFLIPTAGTGCVLVDTQTSYGDGS